MKAYRQTHSQAAHAATTSSARLQAFVWFVAATLAMAALLLAGSARAEAPATERIDITLDIEKLPAADLTRVRDRLQAIDLTLTSQTKLFRSFAAREVLAESLQVLAANGADIGASAVINFDSIEIDIPAGTRDTAGLLARAEAAAAAGRLDLELVAALLLRRSHTKASRRPERLEGTTHRAHPKLRRLTPQLN